MIIFDGAKQHRSASLAWTFTPLDSACSCFNLQVIPFEISFNEIKCLNQFFNQLRETFRILFFGYQGAQFSPILFFIRHGLRESKGIAKRELKLSMKSAPQVPPDNGIRPHPKKQNSGLYEKFARKNSPGQTASPVFPVDSMAFSFRVIFRNSG
jgi:hypothetical protein